jgi:hypothetical protein
MAEQVRSVRLNSGLWTALEEVATRLNRVPELTLHGQVTVSTVIRLALFEGLLVLGKKYGVDLSKP